MNIVVQSVLKRIDLDKLLLVDGWALRNGQVSIVLII